ncbi:hypothetical protein BCR34DRAFT_592488 [Clohesyomyces aquaticus]|uniref:Uncharacterized protein n=1 Tax=Clohesyomyces aquaticus TaxID=1231657 RepID=A0A1Y1YRK2_9PLEO|nr:hypothetical protein BCR34DRAFT_592488 [Clohesyomyces aquaticus]
MDNEYHINNDTLQTLMLPELQHLQASLETSLENERDLLLDLEEHRERLESKLTGLSIQETEAYLELRLITTSAQRPDTPQPQATESATPAIVPTQANLKELRRPVHAYPFVVLRSDLVTVELHCPYCEGNCGALGLPLKGCMAMVTHVHSFHHRRMTVRDILTEAVRRVVTEPELEELKRGGELELRAVREREEDIEVRMSVLEGTYGGDRDEEEEEDEDVAGAVEEEIPGDGQEYDDEYAAEDIPDEDDDEYMTTEDDEVLSDDQEGFDEKGRE